MAKRQRTAPAPEDIVKGSVVFYNGDKRGVVRDAFAPLDQFWIADEQTNELIRDADGEIIAFSASKLLIATEDKKTADSPAAGCARVLLIGNENHMLQILEEFGAPDAVERRDIQQLLAVPCSSMGCSSSCARFDPAKRSQCNREECQLLHLASDGIEEAMVDLARRLRPDIFVDIRPFHLKQAAEQIGPDMNQMEGWYCLSSVTLPFGKGDIVTASGWEKYWMEEVRCQIDLGVSGEAAREETEASLEETARRALAESCRVGLSDGLWSDEEQFRLRRQLGVDMPLKFWDGPETKVFLILLPEDAVSFKGPAGILFKEKKRINGTAGRPTVTSLTADPTIGSWKDMQDQFKDLPKLPEGWIRIRSRKTNEIYYWDTRNNKPSYEVPLPPGWTKQKSKTTGKVYYFNAKKRKSSFEVPTE
jgi:hypothetical protein